VARLTGAAWFVRNARDFEWWRDRPGGHVASFIEDRSAQVGVNLFVLEPGQPMAMYHWEGDQEGFLVLSGEALLIVDGEEHPLRQWDYFHCPPKVAHTIVGSGAGQTAILALGFRSGADEGAYPVSEVARRHDASAEEDTDEPAVAYARFPREERAEFSEAWLDG